MHMPLPQAQLVSAPQPWYTASYASSGSVSPQAQSPAHSQQWASPAELLELELHQEQIDDAEGFNSSAHLGSLSANSPSWASGGGGGGVHYTSPNSSNNIDKANNNNDDHSNSNNSDSWLRERREDPSTGGYFTRAEFVQYYGNDHVWSEATSPV